MAVFVLNSRAARLRTHTRQAGGRWTPNDDKRGLFVGRGVCVFMQQLVSCVIDTCQYMLTNIFLGSYSSLHDGWKLVRATT